jgi:hypothetical protein
MQVHIIGRFLKNQQEAENCEWSCMFEEVIVLWNFSSPSNLTRCLNLLYQRRTVASLISLGATPDVTTDPCPKYHSGRTPADLASANGHQGIVSYLADSASTIPMEVQVHISSLGADPEAASSSQPASLARGMDQPRLEDRRQAKHIISNLRASLLIGEDFEDKINAFVRGGGEGGDSAPQTYLIFSFFHNHDLISPNKVFLQIGLEEFPLTYSIKVICVP